MILEVVAEVVLAQPKGEIRKPSAPKDYGFITSFGKNAYAAAVLPDGSGFLVPEQLAVVRLRFLFPERAIKVTEVGAEFTFFEQGRIGTGRVLSVRHEE